MFFGDSLQSGVGGIPPILCKIWRCISPRGGNFFHIFLPNYVHRQICLLQSFFPDRIKQGECLQSPLMGQMGQRMVYSHNGINSVPSINMEEPKRTFSDLLIYTSQKAMLIKQKRQVAQTLLKLFPIKI